MDPLEFHYRGGGVHLPRMGLWLDAPFPVRTGELCFVSHAHSDHTARHARVCLSEPTRRLMRARLAGEREEIVLPWGEAVCLRELGVGGSLTATVTLVPAGHILGSAMILVACEGRTLLYTGDFALAGDGLAERCEPRHSDVLILETTFGRPAYVFPTRETVRRRVVEFCRESLASGQTPLLLGYSLGKAQVLLSTLLDSGFPVVVAESVAEMTRVYEEFGHRFPPYGILAPGNAEGRVVICPAGRLAAGVRSAVDRPRVAVATGWAMDAGCRFRYGADEAIPLSDHADFPALNDFVRAVAPSRVGTLHGFAADFAGHLRALGVDARALSEPDQLLLPLGLERGLGLGGDGIG